MTNSAAGDETGDEAGATGNGATAATGDGATGDAATGAGDPAGPARGHRGLRGSFTDPGLAVRATAGHEVVGLDGVLATRGHRARRVRVPGAAVVDGFRWRLRDVYSPTWWPQGIAVGDHDGTPLVITSWFAQPRRTAVGVLRRQPPRRQGARISILDLGDPLRPRYHHVLLVAPRLDGDTVVLDPVPVHAGGIVWAGDRLLVAATLGGIREFHLSDIMRAPSAGVAGRPAAPFGYRHVLPQAAHFRPPKGQTSERMRYSFIAIETGARPAAGDGLALIAGEYARDDQRRVARLTHEGERTVVTESHVAGIPEMQGAVVHDGTWYVNASRGDRAGGDLWVGVPGAMVRHAGVLPPGPEDIASWPDRAQLWSVTEFPGKRWVYAVDRSAFEPDRG